MSHPATRAPSARYARYVVAILTVANVSAFMDRQILSLLVVPIKRDLGISDTQMSYLIGLSFSVFYTVLGIPIARLADRYSRRAIMAWGVAAWSLFTAACGVVSGYGPLLALRIGVGVGEASLVAPSVSLLADYFPRERIGRAMSVYSLGIFLGSGLAYLVGGEIVGLVSSRGIWVLPLVGAIHPWQTVFFFVGLPGLVVALLFLTVREPVRGAYDTNAGAVAPTSRVPIREVLGYVRAHLRTFATHSLGFALSASVNFGIAAWLATFLIRAYGWTPARAGMVQGILTMTVGVLGTIAGGWVSDRLVARGHVDGPLRVGMIGAAGMLVSATAYPLMPSAALAVAWLVPVNFFAAFPWGAASAAAAEIAPPALRAQGVSIYYLVLNLVSGALGPTSVALLTDHVFHAERAIGSSLAIVNVVGMAGTLVLLGIGLPAFRRTVAEVRGS